MHRIVPLVATLVILVGCTDAGSVDVTAPRITAAITGSTDLTVAITDLGTLGGVNANATGVNTLGHIVGTSERSDLSSHAFLWSAEGGMVDLGDLGGGLSIAIAVNDRDEVVGRSRTASGDQHAFLWTPATGMRDLGTFPDATVCEALDVNNTGDVVGQCGDLAFRWTVSTGMVSLGELVPQFGSRAVAISNRGEVVGVADIFTAGLNLPRAFLWTADAGMRSLGTLDQADPLSESFAYDINDAGTILGNSFGTNGGDDFLWTAESGMQPLNEPHFQPKRINAQGDIAGSNNGGALRLADGAVVPLPPLPNDPGGEEGPGAPVALTDERDGRILLVGTTPGATGRTDQLRGSRAVLWTVTLATVLPPTPEERITALIGRVAALVDAHVLGVGEGTALNAKLQAAQRSLQHGARDVAVNQLHAFINQVNALQRSERLTSDQADALRDAALAAVATLGGAESGS